MMKLKKRWDNGRSLLYLSNRLHLKLKVIVCKKKKPRWKKLSPPKEAKILEFEFPLIPKAMILSIR